MEFSKPFLVNDWSVDVNRNFDLYGYFDLYFLFNLYWSVNIDRLIDIDRLVNNYWILVNRLIYKDLLFDNFRNLDLLHYHLRNSLFDLDILGNFDYFFDKSFRSRYIFGNLDPNLHRLFND